MKKFIIILLLLAACGAALYFGWAQRTVPPGYYGVMRSRTHGLESKVIREGEFRWIWYKLIPTNATVSVYSLRTVRHAIRSSGRLQSGDVYAGLAGIEADFSWEISGEASFSLKPECLPELCVTGNITDDAGLRAAEDALAEKIGSFALQRIREYAEGADESKLEPLLIAGSLPELTSSIEQAFPEIENLSCTVKAIRLPDFRLYQAVKELYGEYLASQNMALKPDIIKESEYRIEIRNRMDELSRYGELLTKYPILLDYLALEKGFPPASGADRER